MASYMGQQFGNYRLIKLLGFGGFAEVYLGRQVHMGTQAAVKVLTGRMTPEAIARFRNEARIMIELRHQNIARVFEYRLEEHIHFIVMEYAPQGSLRERHPEGTRVPLLTVVEYDKQVAAALQYIHNYEQGEDKKFVHRDVKPHNMLISKHNEILLSDFGIAAVAHKTASLSTQEAIGTVTYMAPEQIRGKARPASDQYSLGVVVYEWLSWVCPFQGASSIEIAMKHLSDSPPPLREKIPTLSSEVEQAVMKALAKEPENRHRTVMDFAIALEKAIKHPSLILQSRCQLEDDKLSRCVWSPNGKYISVIDKKSITIFKAHNGEKAFACNHGLDELGVRKREYTPVWSSWARLDAKAELDVNAETITCVHRSGTPVLVDKLTGEVVVYLWVANDAWPVYQFRHFPDTSQSKYWSDPFVESLKVLINMDRSPQAKSFVSGLSPFYLYDDDCLWSPDLEYVAICRTGIASVVGREALATQAREPSMLPGHADDQKEDHPLMPGRNGGSGNGFPRLTWRLLWIALVAIVLTLLVFGALFLAFLGPLKNLIPGIAPYLSQRQLSSTSGPQSRTVNATGVRQTVGVEATGTITFYNSAFVDQHVNAGTDFLLANGMHIVTDRGVDISRATGTPPNIQHGMASVSAHADIVGPGGNIAALTINHACCTADSSIFAKNLTAFTGGQDPQNFTVVQRSDIDGAATLLEHTLTPQAQHALKSQIHPNEQLVSPLQCASTVTSNHRVGDKANNVTVTVTVTCTGEVSDQQVASLIATNVLMQQAAKTPASGSALVGNPVTAM